MGDKCGSFRNVHELHRATFHTHTLAPVSEAAAIAAAAAVAAAWTAHAAECEATWMARAVPLLTAVAAAAVAAAAAAGPLIFAAAALLAAWIDAAPATAAAAAVLVTRDFAADLCRRDVRRLKRVSTPFVNNNNPLMLGLLLLSTHALIQCTHTQKVHGQQSPCHKQ